MTNTIINTVTTLSSPTYCIAKDGTEIELVASNYLAEIYPRPIPNTNKLEGFLFVECLNEWLYCDELSLAPASFLAAE